MDWNRNRKLIFLLILFFSQTALTLCAQETVESTNFYPEPTIESPEQVIEQEEPATEETNTTLWTDEQWKKAKDGIDYQKDPEKKKKEIEEEEVMDVSPDESFNLGEWLSGLFLSPAGKLIAILLIIGILVFMVTRLLMNSNADSKVKVTEGDILAWLNEEDIPLETDLERYLREAIESGNYKLAVRILYLGTIRQLNEYKLINWKKDKTNRDYLNEMRSRSDYREFRDLTLVYEVVWYGDRNISESDFTRIRTAFDSYKINPDGNQEKS